MGFERVMRNPVTRAPRDGTSGLVSLEDCASFVATASLREPLASPTRTRAAET